MNTHIAAIMILLNRLVEARNCWMEAAVARAEEMSAAESKRRAPP